MLVSRLMDKAREEGAQGILVVLEWPQSAVAREIRACEELELAGRWRPFFECPVWFENNIFRGWALFDVLIFRMRF